GPMPSVRMVNLAVMDAQVPLDHFPNITTLFLNNIGNYDVAWIGKMPKSVKSLSVECGATIHEYNLVPALLANSNLTDVSINSPFFGSSTVNMVLSLPLKSLRLHSGTMTNWSFLLDSNALALQKVAINNAKESAENMSMLHRFWDMQC